MFISFSVVFPHSTPPLPRRPGLGSVFNHWNLYSSKQKQLTMIKNLRSTLYFIAFLHFILTVVLWNWDFIISILQARDGIEWPSATPKDTAGTRRFQDLNPWNWLQNLRHCLLRLWALLSWTSWLRGVSVSHLEASGVYSPPGGHSF